MKQRVVTVLWIVPVVLAAVFFRHPLPIAVVCLLAAFAASYELALLRGCKRLPFVGTLVMAVYAAFPLHNDTAAQMVLAVPFLLGVLVSARLWKGFWADEVAGLWVSAPIAAAYLLHRSDASQLLFDWRTPLLLCTVPVWAGDTAAYFVGKWIGKHPLAPTISPNKTIEGGVANLAGGILMGVWLATLLALPAWIGAICGACAGIFGQIGDLFESWLKRVAGTKDSGKLLSGHGGMLDRLDSLLFALIPIALAITWYENGSPIGRKPAAPESSSVSRPALPGAPAASQQPPASPDPRS